MKIRQLQAGLQHSIRQNESDVLTCLEFYVFPALHSLRSRRSELLPGSFSSESSPPDILLLLHFSEAGLSLLSK